MKRWSILTHNRAHDDGGNLRNRPANAEQSHFGRECINIRTFGFQFEIDRIKTLLKVRIRENNMQDTVAEWLRCLAANEVGFPRAGSNPASVDLPFSQGSFEQTHQVPEPVPLLWQAVPPPRLLPLVSPPTSLCCFLPHIVLRTGQVYICSLTRQRKLPHAGVRR
jgi:hypothetical protein